MFEAFTPSHRAGKKTKPRSIRLFVEELEGRCLLSSGFGPVGGITTGPDGEIWFLEKDRLGRIDPTTGLIQEFAQGINTGLSWYGSDTAGNSIAEAPDGSLWFLSNSQVIRFTPSTNALSTFNLSAGSSPLDSITIGQDGVVWVLEQQGQAFGIARIDPANGGVENFALGQIPALGGPLGIGSGPDGKIWIALWIFPLEEMDPATGVVQNANSNSGAYYHSYAIPPRIAPDGTYWDLVDSGIPAAADRSIREFNPSTGNYKLFPPTTDYRMMQLTPGPDGNIWYTYVGGSNGILSYYVGLFNPATGAIETFGSGWPGQASTGNPPPATGKNVSALAGINFLTAVASFTPQVPIASPGQAYQATIEWGDGTTSSLVLTVTQNGTYDVNAGHTYRSPGTYTIKVTIGNYNPANPLGDNPVTVFSTANVQALNNDPFAMTW